MEEEDAACEGSADAPPVGSLLPFMLAAHALQSNTNAFPPEQAYVKSHRSVVEAMPTELNAPAPVYIVQNEKKESKTGPKYNLQR